MLANLEHDGRHFCALRKWPSSIRDSAISKCLWSILARVLEGAVPRLAWLVLYSYLRPSETGCRPTRCRDGKPAFGGGRRDRKPAIFSGPSPYTRGRSPKYPVHLIGTGTMGDDDGPRIGAIFFLVGFLAALLARAANACRRDIFESHASPETIISPFPLLFLLSLFPFPAPIAQIFCFSRIQFYTRVRCT
jgi:hypothetical protein